MIPRYDGIFEILKRIGPVAYKLKLPERLQLHPSIQIGFLKPYLEDPDPDKVQAKRRLPNIRKEFNRDMASILKDKNMGNWKVKWTEFLIHWKGMYESEASWEKGATLWQFEDKIQEYLQAKSMRMSKGSREGEGGGLVGPSI